jgi:GDPmannose 4,6-dehydratase
MIDLDDPEDFVVATGEGHTVRDLVSRAFGLVGLDWEKHVRVDRVLLRPSEHVPIVGNSAKLERTLGKRPRVTFDAILRILLAHDLSAVGCAVPFEVPDARIQ